MKRLALGFVSIILLCSISVNLTGCFAMSVSAEDLMDGIIPERVTATEDISPYNAAVCDFALRLMRATEKSGNNTLISPLSVLTALAMTANGAVGDTRLEMEKVFGMSVDEINLYLYSYIASLSHSEKNQLALANSIWFSDDTNLVVKDSFLQKNANYYRAEIYKAPFDNSTKRDINNWVRRETDGMISKIIDYISPYTVMYLINTLAFEAEWTKIYEHSQVRNGTFTTESGEERETKFMYSNEGTFISDDNATGFLKYYHGRKYAFAAILPREDISVTDYLSALDGDSLLNMLNNAESGTVRAAIPKFKTEYEVEMSGILAEMGMALAFNHEEADFSELGEYLNYNIYIDEVLHKTYIEVGEKGTKAGAVTVVQVKNDSAGAPGETKTVYLDRPFVYMIIDVENKIPLFFGTLMDFDK